MNLAAGIVGLPNVGKSTLFSALTKKQVDAANYPFCTIEPNTGIVEVRDPRLSKLAELSSSQKIVFATTTFVDIAGLVKGASKGEGLGNKFLSNIRGTDLICHVVRCFDDEHITHVDGKIDPITDIEIINLELILADLQMAENIAANLNKKAKNDKQAAATLEVVKVAIEHLSAELPVRSLQTSGKLKEDDYALVSQYDFITSKPVIYVPNVKEEDLPHMDNEYVRQVREYAEAEGSQVIPISAKFEAEVAGLDEEDAQEFLDSVGLDKTGLDRLIATSFDALGLMTFLTSGEQESRAWTILKGSRAPQAAGKIHSDFEKGFIRAEVTAYADLVEHGTRVKAKEAGRVRMEGKEYVVQDGDVIVFHHN